MDFVYPFISGRYLGYFHVLAQMNNVVMTVVYEFFCGHVFGSLWYIHRGGIAESHDI